MHAADLDVLLPDAGDDAGAQGLDDGVAVTWSDALRGGGGHQGHLLESEGVQFDGIVSFNKWFTADLERGVVDAVQCSVEERQAALVRCILGVGSRPGLSFG